MKSVKTSLKHKDIVGHYNDGGFWAEVLKDHSGCVGENRLL